MIAKNSMIFLRYFLNILKNRGNLIKIGRPEDCMNFRETPGKIGRVGMSEFSTCTFLPFLLLSIFSFHWNSPPPPLISSLHTKIIFRHVALVASNVEKELIFHFWKLHLDPTLPPQIAALQNHAQVCWERACNVAPIYTLETNLQSHCKHKTS